MDTKLSKVGQQIKLIKKNKKIIKIIKNRTQAFTFIFTTSKNNFKKKRKQKLSYPKPSSKTLF